MLTCDDDFQTKERQIEIRDKIAPQHVIFLYKFQMRKKLLENL